MPTLLIARTDADSAKLITSDVDPRDREFITGERTPEGFFRFRGGIEAAIARGLAFAPYADLLWCETSKPDLEEARQFAEAIHAEFPGKLLAYNCSPSFNWKQKLDAATIASFQRELGAMGYKFQFVTLAGFHALNLGMFELARAYQRERHDRLLRASRSASSRTSAWRATGRSSISASSAPATSTRWRRRSPAAPPPPPPSPGRPRRSSSRPPRRVRENPRRGAQEENAMANVRVEGPGSPAAERVLTPEALEFVAELQRADRRTARADLLRQRARRQQDFARGVQPGFLESTRSIRRDRLGGGAGPAGPPGPPGRDHRPGRAQDDDQRPQLGGERLHGRFRGLPLPHLGERRPGPGQPDGRRPARARLHQPRRKGVPPRRPARDPAGPPARLAPDRAPPPGGRRARSPPASSTSASTSSTTPRSCDAAAPAPTSTCRSWRATLEAALWNQVFNLAQDLLGIPRGTIRATVLIETITAAFEMDEILWELRDHAAGLNAGRWDYIFSIIRMLPAAAGVLPDRFQVTMDVPFMRAYTDLLVHTCHTPRRPRHRRHGGLHPQPPRRGGQPRRPRPQSARTRSARSARASTAPGWPTPTSCRWPGRSSTASSATGRTRRTCCARTSPPPPPSCSTSGSRAGAITEDGVRSNISIALQYLDSWLQGQGAVAIRNLMEDAATAEISRAQLWQWIHHDAALEDGRKVTPELYRELRDQELAGARRPGPRQAAPGGGDPRLASCSAATSCRSSPSRRTGIWIEGLGAASGGVRVYPWDNGPCRFRTVFHISPAEMLSTDHAVVTLDGAGLGEHRLQGVGIDLALDLALVIEVVANGVVDRRGIEMRVGLEDLADRLALAKQLGDRTDGDPAVRSADARRKPLGSGRCRGGPPAWARGFGWRSGA